MINKVNSSLIFKFAAIILIVIAVLWFSLETRSKQRTVIGKTSSVTNSPNQWNQPVNSFSVSDQGEGGVTLTAEYIAKKSGDTTVAFNIYLNTHSVDLTSVDFKRDIYLEKDGKKIYSTASLDSGGGHHRSSRLTFEKVDFPLYIIGENIGGVGRREILFEL